MRRDASRCSFTAPTAVSAAFFIELSSLPDDLATLAEPAFIAGDFNIRIDRPDEVKLFTILESCMI